MREQDTGFMRLSVGLHQDYAFDCDVCRYVMSLYHPDKNVHAPDMYTLILYSQFLMLYSQ